MTRASLLKAIRLTHHYSGVFLAPAILFFAITGGLQMFGLHETSRGSSYVPPKWLVHLSQLHKKGTIYLPPRRPQPPPQATPAGKMEVPKTQPFVPFQPPHNSLPMKIFFGITAFGLVVSTLTGLYMAWQYTRRKGLVAAVFLAGIVIPIGLLFV